MKNLRQILHSSYTFIRSVEINKATASLTLDHLIEEKIRSLKSGEVREIIDSRGETVGNRISYLDRLATLESDMNNVIKALEEAGNNADSLELLGLVNEDLEP